MARAPFDGGQAFPGGYMANQKDRGPVAIYAPGMSLRDYAAIHADITKVAFPDVQSLADFCGEAVPQDRFGLLALSARAQAKIRYMHADAMLAERAKAVRS